MREQQATPQEGKAHPSVFVSTNILDLIPLVSIIPLVVILAVILIIMAFVGVSVVDEPIN